MQQSVALLIQQFHFFPCSKEFNLNFFLFLFVCHNFRKETNLQNKSEIYTVKIREIIIVSFVNILPLSNQSS